MDGLRVTVRVRTGASRPGVGGRYSADALVVSVAARPVNGTANRAVEAALAAAFAVPVRDVAIVAGPAARTKIVLVAGDRPTLQARLDELLSA